MKVEGVVNADGRRYLYRRVSSVLERRDWSSSAWFKVTGEMFLTMTPVELRYVADVIDGSEAER